MKTIALTRGMFATVDDEDFNDLSAHKWSAMKFGGKIFYAARNAKVDGKQAMIFMHRVITNAPKGLSVDHINCDPLDNRRENLRVCTHEENMRNSRKHAISSSRFKGVSFETRPQKWKAQISFKNKSIRIGTFENEEDAAHAYDDWAKALYREFARTNF